MKTNLKIVDNSEKLLHYTKKEYIGFTYQKQRSGGSIYEDSNAICLGIHDFYAVISSICDSKQRNFKDNIGNSSCNQ